MNFANKKAQRALTVTIATLALAVILFLLFFFLLKGKIFAIKP